MPAENCPYAEMGQNCGFQCVLCSFRHECIYCGFKERQESRSSCVSPFRDLFEMPTKTPAPRTNDINNEHDHSSDARDKEVEQVSPCGISAVQLEEISQTNREISAEASDARDKEILPQTRLAYRSESPNQNSDGSSSEADEYDEDEISSQAETDLLAGYACILCDEPDDTDAMVECELDTGWFHFSCVGLTTSPPGKWYCPFCVSSQPHQSKGLAASPQSTPANHIDPSLQFQERASSPTTITSDPSNSTSSTVLHVENRPKKQTSTSKKTTSAPQIHTSSQIGPRKENWKANEKKYVIGLMQEVVNEGETTEQKWAIVSRRLMSRYAVDRSVGSVKNWWNRHGRAMSNIDERIVPKPNKLETGRRKERQSTKRGANGMESDHSMPSSQSRKRQKSNVSHSESMEPV